MGRHRIGGRLATNDAGQHSASARMEEIYAAHFEAVRAYCLRRLPTSEANDAVSEVFLLAWRRLDALPEPEAVRPWLLRTAYNKIAHARRGYSRRARLAVKLSGVAETAADAPDVEVVAQYQRDRVTAALGKLRAGDREVIRLRAWEELSAPGIAAVLDVSVSAAEKRIGRALKRLATVLGAGPQDDQSTVGGGAG